MLFFSESSSKYENTSLFVNAMQKPRRASEKKSMHIRRDFSKLDRESGTDEATQQQEQQRQQQQQQLDTVAETSFSTSNAFAGDHDGYTDNAYNDDASSLGSGLGFGSDVSSSDWS